MAHSVPICRVGIHAHAVPHMKVEIHEARATPVSIEIINTATHAGRPRGHKCPRYEITPA